MNYKETYELWLNSNNVTTEEKEILKAMNEEQIKDAFSTHIAFGTAGMRGIMGPGTNRINTHTIAKATLGYAKYIVANNQQKAGIAIGYDNRHQSCELAIMCANILANNGITCYIYKTLRPTPMLSYAVRYHKCFGGIMITASHNPKQYNGYKLYDTQGCQLIPSLAEQVIKTIEGISNELEINVDYTNTDNDLIHYIANEVDESYYKDVETIQLRKEINKDDLKIIFTPQHGTANIPVKHILDTTGYKYIAVEEQCNPDPDFSNTLTPNPEEKESYKAAIELAKKEKADIVLSCDPDADRMGVVALHNDEYILLSGNQTGSILLEYIFSTRKEKNMMPKNPVMFNTVVTSDLGEKIANNYNVECIKTLTGFKFIGEKIANFEITKEKNFVFGYEESYGYLLKEIVRDKDAVQACLILSEASAYYKTKGLTLVDVLNQLYAKYGYYEESQTSIFFEGSEGASKMQTLLTNFRKDKLATINNTKVIKTEDYLLCTTTIEDESKELIGYAKSDVLKYYLEDGSWIAIRPSGTEPKCKFYYCIKGKTLEEAKNKTTGYAKAISDMIK
ncbi:MAG: phospho-sugar mutase [Erysipelotrichaceae bacterium]